MSNHLNYSKSRWNGWNGNECVYKKEYHKAIEYYNTAIELYPSEYRYFVNRSFCFDRLHRFELALEDAQRALLLQSEWGKCYYRKARALKGLNRLEEAELCFLKVIQLEGSDCKEAQHELRTLRERLSSGLANAVGDEIKSDSKEEDNKKNNKISAKALSPKTNVDDLEVVSNEDKRGDKDIDSEMKYKKLILREGYRERNILKELSEFLLNRSVLPPNETKVIQINTRLKSFLRSDQKSVSDGNKSTKIVENEIKMRNNRRNGRKGMDEIVEIWDDSRNHWSPTSNRSQNINPKRLPFRKTEPTNPWNFRGLYISNIRASEETKQILRQIMSDFGKVTLIDLIGANEVIVNFDNPESPRVAMSRLQGVHMSNICVGDQKLRIRFRPLNDSKNYPSLNCASDRLLNNECYFWRTTGCNYPKFCKLKHICVNKGVDYQPWMQSMKNKYRRQHPN